MAISGLPTNGNDNTVTVTPTGVHGVDGQAGTDTLVVNYGTLSTSIYYRYIANGFYGFVDDFFTGVHFYSFERFNITGGSGDDQLQGADDVDVLNGGAGADVITSGLGADTINGGTGYDRWIANYSGLNVDVSATLLASGASAITGSGASVTGIEAAQLTFGSGNDLFDSTAVTGNDDVFGGWGNDEFRSNGGIDWFNGDNDTDKLVVDYSDATTAVTHHYVANGWYAVGDKAGTQMANYINVENFDITGGSASDTLEGSSGNDRLVGNDGNDRLYGRAGIDEINGGNGTDTWIVDYTDLLDVTLNLTTQTTNSGAVFSGIEAINFTGGAGDDVVTGNAGRYNDNFFGGGGDDVFVTGRGVDYVNGDNATDKVVMDWSAITDPLHGIHHDYVANGWYAYSSLSGDYMQYINVENFDLTGGAGADSLFGGAAYDWLRGNGGNDSLDSGTGDALVDGGAGNDRWAANLSAETRSVRFDAVLSQTTAQATGSGSNVRNIEQLSLSTGAAADVISTDGYALNDSVNLGGGNDSVNTGLGFDGANGEAGSDTLIVNYASLSADVDKSYVANGWYRYSDAEGTASVDFINFEKFNLTGGSGNDHLYGADQADRLTGGDGNDVLDGFRGADVIAGGTGNDTWVGDYSNATAALTINANSAGTGALAGTATSVSSIENFTLSTGAGNDVVNLTYSQGNDIISTGSGNDTIDVGRGKFEQVDGGLDTDALTLDMSAATSGVRMEYYANGWWHAVSAAGDYEARFINVESFNILGSSKADRLQGFAGNDTLNGGAASDILTGNEGADTLTGGTGNDMFYFGAVWTDGQDKITDATAGDFLRLNGVGLGGNVTAGNGTGLGAGQVMAQIGATSTTLHVGLDATAGADFHVTLQGVFTLADFQLAGGDILIV